MTKIQELKDKVRELISRNDDLYKNKVKPAWTFLYKYLEELGDIETLERLKGIEGGKYLFAYLAYKSISRANFQPEHLQLTSYEDVNQLVGALETDILNYEKGLDKPPREPNPTELLQMLRRWMEKGEIKGELTGYGTDFPSYTLETKDYIVDLGEIEVEDPEVEADKFLEKHGLKSEDKHDLVKCPKCSNTKFLWDDKEKKYYCQNNHQKEIIK